MPELPDLWGPAFDAAYTQAEARGLARKTLPARDLYGRMMRTLAQTGNGWMTFKDKSNRACNQTGRRGAVVHLSNLCTEILEVTEPCGDRRVQPGQHQPGPPRAAAKDSTSRSWRTRWKSPSASSTGSST